MILVPVRAPSYCVEIWLDINILTIIAGNYNYDRINSDKLAPPGTDHGQTINAQWPMGKSTRLRGGMYNLLTICQD